MAPREKNQTKKPRSSRVRKAKPEPLTEQECIDVVELCARGGDVSPTQLRAAVYRLEDLRRDPGDAPADDTEAAIYGDNVTPLRSAKAS